MTKLEEIREGITEILQRPLKVSWQGDGSSTIEQGIKNQAEEILSYLHSQGIVIKVDKELPFDVNKWQQEMANKQDWYGQGCFDTTMEMLSAGYVAVEPLIKES